MERTLTWDSVPESRSLVHYDRMVQAIAECHRVDEIKDLRDKTVALQLYYKQAHNTEAERKASDIRLRAERRVGELLKELARIEPAERNPNGEQRKGISPGAGTSPYAAALADNGISTQQASRFQALANIPAEVFEEALSDPIVKPTTRALINEARCPQPKTPSDSLWIWGRSRDFERMEFNSKNTGDLVEAMTDPMLDDVLRLSKTIAGFFQSLNKSSHDEHVRRHLHGDSEED